MTIRVSRDRSLYLAKGLTQSSEKWNIKNAIDFMTWTVICKFEISLLLSLEAVLESDYYYSPAIKWIYQVKTFLHMVGLGWVNLSILHLIRNKDC